MDETFNFILELQAFIRVMAVVPVVPTVLIAVSIGGWSVHPSSWRELVHNFYENFGPRSIQGGEVMEPRSGTLRGVFP